MSGPVVVTAVAGRGDHLRRQRAGLMSSSSTPPLHVVVAIGDGPVPEATPGPPVHLAALPGSGPLPVAAARNLGADIAFDHADTVVFLDVDVIPAPGLLASYASALDRRPDTLLSGPVAYLPPGAADGPLDLDRFPAHPARPVPPDGEVWPEPDPALFWSLSFAVHRETWRRIGGFATDYTGYGAEDTDLAMRAVTAGVGFAWVGGAVGFHQHHAVSDPPVEHLEDILRNGRTFFQRWGWWPMQGWFDGFERLGLVRRDGDMWVATS